MTKLKSNIAISESGFVFDPNTGDSFSMNPIGLEILKLMEAGQSQEEILSVILERYDIDSDMLEHNYFDFLGMLRQFNLLEKDHQ